MNKQLVTALHKVVSESEEREFDMQLLMTIGSNDRTEEFYLSEEGDEEWEYQVDEGNYEESERETFAREESQFWLDAGYPNSNFFDEPKKLPSNIWLAHFTDSDPEDIVKKGFKGKEYSVLGLTSDGMLKGEDGPYAFAYRADAIAETWYNNVFGKYGTNLVLFKDSDAVESYHSGDEEKQVIFITYTAHDMHPVWGNDDKMTIYDKEDEEFICDRDQECINKLIEVIEDKS